MKIAFQQVTVNGEEVEYHGGLVSVPVMVGQEKIEIEIEVVDDTPEEPEIEEPTAETGEQLSLFESDSE